VSGIDASTSLVEFARKQRQKDCPVCALDTEIRAQLRSASDKGIRRPVQLAWLREVHRSSVTDADLTSHYSAKHDDA
jgi:hypothetical protein